MAETTLHCSYKEINNLNENLSSSIPWKLIYCKVIDNVKQDESLPIII